MMNTKFGGCAVRCAEGPATRRAAGAAVAAVRNSRLVNNDDFIFSFLMARHYLRSAIAVHNKFCA